MEKEVYFGGFFEVETNEGTEIVPETVFSFSGAVRRAGRLQPYVRGNIVDPAEWIVKNNGWLARMTMPGCLDCTDWTWHDSEEEANEYLDNMYGD